MRLSSLDITLADALQKFGLSSLPAEYNPNAGATLIDGIALVTKVGGIREYCAVASDGDSIYISQDFGCPATVASLDKIYVVNKLDKRFMPDLRSDKQIIEFLSKNNYDPKLITSLLDKDAYDSPEKAKAARDVVKKYVIRAAIKVAKKTLAEEARVREMRQMSKK